MSQKKDTHRTAIAAGNIRMKPETLAIIQQGSAKKAMSLALRALLQLWQQNEPAT
jgi:molybdenum cofactor biosynthesis enzyme